MIGRELLKPGMMVHTRDGQKLGKIQELGPDYFVIEKGMLFKKEYTCDYGLVSDVRGDDVIISRASAEIGREHGEESFAGSRRSEAGEVNIPVAEEELDVRTHERESGEVRVSKDVVTEEKTVSVPVTRERVSVERVPASANTRASEASVTGGDVTIPVREEEVEVRKRPVVKEEVRVRKERTEEPRMIAETLRKERVNVEGEDETSSPARSPYVGPDDDSKTRY